MALSDAETISNLALGLLGEYVIEDSAASRLLKPAVLCARFYTLARDETLRAHPWNEAKARVISVQDATNPLFGYDRRYAVEDDCLRVLRVNDSSGADISNNNEGIPAWEVEGDYILSDAGETPPSWLTETDYIAGHYVTNDSISYICILAHTAGDEDDEPGVGADTDTYWTSAGGDYKIVYVEYIFQETDPDNWSPQLKRAIALNLASKVITGLTNDTKGKVDLINEYERLVMPSARSIDGAEGKPRQHYNSEWLRARGGGGGGGYYVV